MKREKVRTIAFGGRPAEAPMQDVGGAKGAQREGIHRIERLIHEANRLIGESARTSSPKSRKSRPSTPLMDQSEWKKFNDSCLSTTRSFYLDGTVNLADEYNPDDSQTPLQFVKSSANCRLFYTAENYNDRTTVWQAAAQAMFGGGGCVKGST